MSSLALPIGALLISIYLCIKFFAKKHITNNETKIYAEMLISNIVFNILCILTFMIAKLTYNNVLVGYFQKIYMLSMLYLIMCIVLYNISIIKNNDEQSTIRNSFTAFFIIISAIVMLLPINVINDGDILDGNGLAYDVILTCIVVFFLISTILSIYLILKEKNNMNKVIPFSTLFVLFIIGFLIRNYSPSLMFENFLFAFMLMVMSDTIENPDVKMIQELNRTCQGTSRTRQSCEE